MKRKTGIILMLTLCLSLSLFGCRRKARETESETQTETVTEKKTEKETEKETQKSTTKTTEKTTEKKTSASSKNTSGTEKTTVKPSTVTPNTSGSSNSAAYPTQQCPYCYQQISTAPNGDGTTVYSVHVAQEKSWADTYGYGNTPATEPQQSSTNSNTGDDSAQCPYCYQWFSVSDGTYASHVASEANTANTGASTTPNTEGSGTVEYIQCPNCGNVYPSGNAYNNHVCAGN